MTGHWPASWPLAHCWPLAATNDPGRSPAAPPPPPPPSAYAYVTNEDSHDLTIINADNDSVIGTIPVGTRPRGVKVSHDGKLVFVALTGSPKCPPAMSDADCEKLGSDKSKDGVAVVDAASRTVSRVLPGGSDPETFTLSADDSKLYVSNEDAGMASIVDVATGKILATVPTGKEPEGVTARARRQVGLGQRRNQP